jgi:uncharacterized membrane protein YkvA (DUF1232 family)
MTQPWEDFKRSKMETNPFRKKIKKFVKAVPLAFTMIAVTYTCFLYMSLVKRDKNIYNN